MKITRRLNILHIHNLALVAILCSCSNHQDRQTKDSFSEDSIPKGYTNELVEGDPDTYTNDDTPSERISAIADTVQIKNGIEVIQIFGLGPQNEYLIFKDRRRRPMTIVSHASEIDAQILTFSYGAEGRITLVRESKLDILKWHNDPEMLLRYIRKGDIAFEYRFLYNEEGRLTEIRRKDTSSESKGKPAIKVMKASEGNHLEGDFRPVEGFWMSDLHGGRMDIHCHEVPDDTDREVDNLRSWINFDKVSEFDNPPIMAKEFFREPKAISFGQTY